MCKSTLLIESNVTQMHIIERDITKNLNYIDVARDLSHFGPLVHRKFARYIFDKFKRKHDVT